MNSLNRRLNNLEHRFGTVRNAARYVVIMADRDLSPEEEAYVEMLHKAGSFPGGVVSMVGFHVNPLWVDCNRNRQVCARERNDGYWPP